LKLGRFTYHAEEAFDPLSEHGFVAPQRVLSALGVEL